jgi:hypothetical protein
MTPNDLIKEASLRTPDSAIDGQNIVAGQLLSTPTRAVYFGTGGTATLTFADGSIATFQNLLAGVVYPFSIRSVATAGLTAGGIVALF